MQKAWRERNPQARIRAAYQAIEMNHEWVLLLHSHVISLKAINIKLFECSYNTRLRISCIISVNVLCYNHRKIIKEDPKYIAVIILWPSNDHFPPQLIDLIVLSDTDIIAVYNKGGMMRMDCWKKMSLCVLHLCVSVCVCAVVRQPTCS